MQRPKLAFKLYLSFKNRLTVLKKKLFAYYDQIAGFINLEFFKIIPLKGHLLSYLINQTFYKHRLKIAKFLNRKKLGKRKK